MSADVSKKDILFLCQFFYPEYNSSAALPFDTAKYLASKGLRVDALVGYPKEYSTEKDLPLTETAEGVEIRRVRYLQLRRDRKLGRLINYFTFTVRMLMRFSGLKDYKAVIVYSNPPVLPVIPILAKRKFGTKFVFVVYDVYPEVAYASRSLTPGSLISRVMNRINRSLYDSADRVVALTDEMKEYLLKRRPGLSRDRVVTIPNWAHEGVTAPSREIRERFGCGEGQLIVSYFGNMGTCQDVETMLEAAELLKEDDRIRFLIIGHGNKKEYVRRRIRDRQLSNIRLMDYMTGVSFQEAVAVSSCGIVSLEKGLMGTCAPSKYYTYLQAGQPVLAVVEAESYLAAEVEREKIGYAVGIGDGEALAARIRLLAGDPDGLLRMGERAKKRYEEQYAYPLAMEKYGSVFDEFIS